jgi:hypothetical protein
MHLVGDELLNVAWPAELYMNEEHAHVQLGGLDLTSISLQRMIIVDVLLCNCYSL